jgi:predicted anti-sigma-YlaC factor YlaD
MTHLDGHLGDDRAQLLLDGALAPDEAARAEAHLHGCAACAALVDSYRLLSGALDDLGALELPEVPLDFTEGVLARIDAREHAVARERRAALAICAAVLVAIAAGLALLGQGSWAPRVVRFVREMGETAGALKIGADVLPSILSMFRVQLAVVCTALAVPVLFALSRLMPSPRTEIA